MPKIWVLLVVVVGLGAPVATWACGLPVRRWRHRDVCATAAWVDRRGLIAAATVAALVAATMLAGWWSAAAMVIVPLCVVPFCLVVGVDRWDRTNGARNPLARLLEMTACPPASPSDAVRQRAYAAAEQLTLPLLRELDGVSAEVQRRRLCSMLVPGLLRTSLTGEPLWVRADDDIASRREVLLTIAAAEPATRAGAVRSARAKAERAARSQRGI